MPPAKRKKKNAAAAGPTSYSCVVGVPEVFPNAYTVLIVPRRDARHVRVSLSGASDKLYKSWQVDGSRGLDSVEGLPKSLGHVVASVPKDLPKAEHEILQVLIDGKVSATKYLYVEIRDGKDDHNEAVKWRAFKSNNTDLLEKMRSTMRNFDEDGDCCYVGECEIVGSKAHPELTRCGKPKELTKSDVKVAVETVEQHWYLRDYL